MLGFIWAVLTSKLFIINTLIGIAMFEWSLAAVQPLRNRSKAEKEIDDKHPEFQRHDIPLIQRHKLIWLTPIILPRYIIAWSGWIILWIYVNLVEAIYGRPKGNYMTKTDEMIVLGTRAQGILNRLMGGIRLKHIKVKADYKEYLGPDWKPRYDGHCTLVSNHVSWWDILVHLSVGQVSFTAKAATTKIPFVGPVSKSIGCLYFDRGDSKSRKDVMVSLEERYKLIKEGKYPQLIMNAEGGTTNGRYLVKFKKGAFVGNYPCKPVVLKYKSNTIDMEQCIMLIYHHIILCGVSAGCYVEYYTMPVFEPNDYFFKNHQREGEE